MTGSVLKKLQDREMEYGPLADQEQSWKHWKLAEDDNGIAWLYFDQADSGVNVLAQVVLKELGEIVEKLSDKTPAGLVIRSLKPSGFCVGANIDEFRDMGDEEAVVEKLDSAHAIVNRLAGLSCPTVSIIHGPCLGGGLELALSCDYRLALPDAKLGAPEIMLGLHPGLGGTARLTRLVDPIEAMTLMLTGKTLDARRAKKTGLIDKVIEERHVLSAVEAVMDGEFKQHSSSLKERLLTTKPARQLEARRMRSKSAEKAPPEHYPAPNALIELWEEHGGDTEEMLKEEIRSFAKLMVTPTAQNLIRVFFVRERLKKEAKVDAEPIRQVHVIGAGAMGGDIAGWCAYNGLRVTLFDMKPEMIAQAVKNAAELCRKKHRSESETRDILDRLIPDVNNIGARQADLVIEAVPEKLEIKHKVYEEVEPQMKPDAILATNTSSIPLKELTKVLKKPARFIGLHFFNPVAKMQLVEVVDQDKATQKTKDRAKAFVGTIDRLPVPVASAPGFLVNRALMPYLLEAIVMIDEGIEAESIDQAAEQFGMPMGPVELADQVGLDICLDVAEMLEERLDEPMPELPDWFRKQVEKGDLGRKSGKGFYKWKNGKPDKNDNPAESDDEVLDRLLLPMLNTCMTCLREKIVEDDTLLDGAMIFGTGFAPFRGGPMNYARERGYDQIKKSLEKLAKKHGERFKPDEGWNGDT